MLIGGRASCTRRFGRQVVLKWWYAARLTRAGFHVLFSDADVAWLADPLAAWERSFDLQGLSDVWRAAACARRSSSGSRQRPVCCAAAKAATGAPAGVFHTSHHAHVSPARHRLSPSRPNLSSSLLPHRELMCRSHWMDMSYWHANKDLYPCQSAGRATSPAHARGPAVHHVAPAS